MNKEEKKEFNAATGEIDFLPGEELPWVMKIERRNNKVRIKFNTKDYPDALENDFAKAVAEILCKGGYLDGFVKEEVERRKLDE